MEVEVWAELRLLNGGRFVVVVVVEPKRKEN